MKALRLAACALFALLLASCGGSGGGEDQSFGQAPRAVASAKAQRVASDFTNVVQTLYVSYLGRPADPAGLTFWAAYLASGDAPTDLSSFNAAYSANASVKTVMDNFGNSPESVALYGVDNGAIVSAIYRNLFNRPAEPAGLAFYVDGLNAGLISTAQAAAMIAGGAQGSDVQAVRNKVLAATGFTAGLVTAQQIAAYSGLTVNSHFRVMLAMVGATSDVNAAVAGMLADLSFPLAGPGELKAADFLNTIAASDIAQALASAGSAARALQPVYDVKSYRLKYLTADVDGNTVVASGLVSVPVKPAGAGSPVLGYQHGTIFHDADAPSNHAVASEVAVVLASLGYIVVAPDYVGYGASNGAAHPYLLADASAAAAVDFLTASRTWRRRSDVKDNGQLFITGYSEGGYVAMAAHRALQSGNSAHLQQLQLVVPGAGPYDVQATLDGLLDLLRDEQPLLGALLNPGFLRYLGPTVRNEVRRALLRYLLPDDVDVAFDTRFIDNYLADDEQAIARLSSVHDWKPGVPVRLFHGRDDRTVPYASALSALQAMQARGAGDLVSLTDCPAVPSSHLGCVPDFLAFTLRQFALQARDL